METHSVSLDVRSALASPSRCAACGSEQLVPVCSGDVVTFVCMSCQQAWDIELGLMVVSDRDVCLACRQGRRCAEHGGIPSQREV